MGIDGRMDEGVSHLRTTTPPALGALGHAVDSPPTTFGDAGLLLDVHVDELAQMGGLDAPDDPSTSTVEVREPAHPVASEDPVQCGRWGPRPWRQSGGTELVASAQLDHLALDLGRGLGRAMSRPARAIRQARISGLLIATPPLVGGLTGDPKGLCRCGDGPPVLDQATEPESWASTGLTDIHLQGHTPGKDVQNGDHGEEEAASASLVHSGVQG